MSGGGAASTTRPAGCATRAIAALLARSAPEIAAYYQADDAASLRATLGAIAGVVLSCSYLLGATPPDPSLLYLYFNRNLVARDPRHASGWDYSAGQNQIDFYG